ncbi:uncharacterized protein LOC128212172 [Mya arenaria]|uniref:uncharacterized protein LOC128212172 n=1 Tax=Mya arenaria TaxID=6604 RepID=UPI0022E70DEE|nr:uncharacterized protein LOC128212172 [Mya arenaria]XP_052773440.1 uncharacterized protein LOC128212172 [Mya arenaria]
MDSTIQAAVLCVAIAITLVFNVFVIVLVALRKRLRTPVTFPRSIIYVFIAVIDILGALFWTLFTVLEALDMKLLQDHMNTCKAQVVVMFICNLLNAHVLAALMFERFLKLFKPSKHQEIFFDLIVILFLVTLLVFDTVIANFPTWGFGEVSFFEDQNQCGVDFSYSVSHLQFTIILHYALPLVLVIGFYVAINIRLCTLRKRRAPNGDIIVEEDLTVVGDSYSDRLKAMYSKFKDAGSSSTKPKVKEETKGYNNDGYHSDEDVGSSDEENVNGENVSQKKSKTAMKLKKTHYLARADVMTTHMYALMSLLYFGMWTPYIAWAIIHTYYYYDTAMSADVILTIVILTHFGACVKVPLYFLSEKMRAAVGKTFGCEKKKNRKTDFDDTREKKAEQTTTEL